MSGRVAILTPDPADEYFQSRWSEVFERNAEPLRSAGLAVEGRAWSDERGVGAFDLVLPLLVWGYPRALPAWRAAVRRWDSAGVPLGNPASVLLWNSEKTYLERLAERGAPVIPTLYAERLDLALLEEAARRFGTDRLVAKPQASSGAWRTIRWSPGEPLDGGPDGPAMVQPYLADIERGGEVSLLYFAGRFSHALRKRPQPGDFRVQPEHRGIITPCEAAPDETAAAERVLAAIGEELLYARIDLVRGLAGRPELIEVELIEPDLYLGYAPDRGAKFAQAVKERIGG